MTSTTPVISTGTGSAHEGRSGRRVDPSSMVGRIASILDAYSAGDDLLSVSEIARRTTLSKSTVARIVIELTERDYLERDTKGVRLGLRLFELGKSAIRPRELREVALAPMSNLRATVNLTVQLAVLERDEVVYVAILPAQRFPPLPSRVGGRMPAYATGVGKALLAFSHYRVMDSVLTRELIGVGPRTITDTVRLRRELMRIRATGLAYDRDESGAGIACVAAPIRGASGESVAALSAAGWTADVDARQVGLAVQAAAESIDRLLARRPRA